MPHSSSVVLLLQEAVGLSLSCAPLLVKLPGLSVLFSVAPDSLCLRAAS